MTDPNSKVVAPDGRTITPAEVGEWFNLKQPSDVQCAEIARSLTHMRWRSDPKVCQDNPKPKKPKRPNSWWDEFQGEANAADKLRASIPAMLARLDQPATRNGYNAIKNIGDALEAGKRYLGNPKPNHRKRPKDWHIPTLLVAHTVGKALAMSGHKPSLERDSVLVGGVNKALCRMGYTVEPGTISAFLKRWEHKYGLGFE